MMTEHRCGYEGLSVQDGHVGCWLPEPHPEIEYDHFHALVNGTPCEHHHHTWQTALNAHNLPLPEGCEDDPE
jgi:hypothetical protein